MTKEIENVLNLVAEGRTIDAIKTEGVKNVLAARGIHLKDVISLAKGTLSQKSIASSLVIACTDSPFFTK